MLCGAHTQKEQALRDSVEDDEEDRSPNRLCRANTRASRDEAKVRDGRIREHALGIHLRDGKERAEQERETTHQDDEDGGPERHCIDGRALDKHEYARLHHGG